MHTWRTLAWPFLALVALALASPKAEPSFTPPDPASVKATVNVSGSIYNDQGIALCGLVLANGQFVFSCSPNGSYNLNVPLDASGQITLYGFAEGHFPYKAVLSAGGRHDMTLSVARAAPPPNMNRDRTELLVGGTWTYTYTIISTWNDQYSFTSIRSTPDQDGDWVATGTSSGGRVAIGMYISRESTWAVLSRTTLFDQFYTFTFSGNNYVTGCYYQVTPSGSTNIGRCYPMFGSRFPLKAYTPSGQGPTQEQEQEQLRLLEDAALGGSQEMDPEIHAVYERLKEQLK